MAVPYNERLKAEGITVNAADPGIVSICSHIHQEMVSMSDTGEDT